MKGDTTTYDGYATDIITNEAIKWLDTVNKRKPFLLMVHHKGSHRNFFPTLKYLQQFHNKKYPEPATLFVDTTNKGSAWKIQTVNILTHMQLCSDLKVDPVYLPISVVCPPMLPIPLKLPRNRVPVPIGPFVNF
jgi:hypothetical protein